MWHDLLVALALVMVIEGILPFLAPGAMRQTMLEVARQSDARLRLIGLLSMASGVGFLYLIN